MSRQGSIQPPDFLSDVIAGDSSDDAFDNTIHGAILTQPPEDEAAPATPSAMDRDDARPPSAPGKRKSKLKKPNRRSSRSVLETVSPATDASAAGTRSAASDGNAGKSSSNVNAGGSDAAGKRNSRSPAASEGVAESSWGLSRIVVGSRIEVYWPDDGKYYPGVVASRKRPSGRGRARKQHVYTIHYDDGDEEHVDLAAEKFRLLGEEPSNAASSSDACIATVNDMRADLEQLVQQNNNSPNKASTRKILSVLRSLDQRDDIDFRVLFHTGVGKVVNKLARKCNNPNISNVASPLLQKWRAIDESTPEEAKAAAKGTLDVNGAVATDKNDGGKLAGAVVPPVTPAARREEAIDLTSSPDPSDVQGSAWQPPPSGKKGDAVSAAAKVTPSPVRGNNGVDVGQENMDSRKGPPSPPELPSASSFKENDAEMLPSAKRDKSKNKENEVPSEKKDEPKNNAAEDSSPPAPSVKRLKQQACSTEDDSKNNAAEHSSPPAPSAKRLKQQPSSMEKSKNNGALSDNVDASIMTSAKTSPPGPAKQPKEKPASTKASAPAQSCAVTQPAPSAKQPKNPKPLSVKSSNIQSAPSAKRHAAATSAASHTQPPKKKKKKSFHDSILYIMLTSCKPYTLKSLAKETNTTVDTLRHAMLSFLDKKLVLRKEFPSKREGSEPKKLYWANPVSLLEVDNGTKGGGGGSGRVITELSRLLSTPSELEEAKEERQRLEGRCRSLQEELSPLLAIPTMKELDDQIRVEELSLSEAHGKIAAVKGRMAAAAAAPPSAPCVVPWPVNRLRTPPPRPRPPLALKRGINDMLGEYKARKRKCMDFVEELSDAMEKRVKDVVGDRVLGLDTDEMEWGRYEDGATGKVYGTARTRMQPVGRGMLGRRNNGKDDSMMDVVKIPAKYKDV